LIWALNQVEKPMVARKRRDITLSRIRSSLTNGSQLFLGDVDERGP